MRDRDVEPPQPRQCPDGESNLRPLDFWEDAHPTESQPSGLQLLFLRRTKTVPPPPPNQATYFYGEFLQNFQCATKKLKKKKKEQQKFLVKPNRLTGGQTEAWGRTAVTSRRRSKPN